MAVDTISKFFRETEVEQDLTWPYKVDRGHRQNINRMVTAIKLANLRIHEESTNNPKCRGMGTTVVSCCFLEDALVIGHVGDSRVYRLSGGALERLTEDHTLVAQQLALGLITPEQARTHALRSLVIRHLGARSSEPPPVCQQPLGRGDRWLLCSDGVHGVLDPDKIRDVLQTAPDERTAAQTIIDLALDAGSRDNVTALVIRYEADA